MVNVIRFANFKCRFKFEEWWTIPKANSDRNLILWWPSFLLLWLIDSTHPPSSSSSRIRFVPFLGGGVDDGAKVALLWGQGEERRAGEWIDGSGFVGTAGGGRTGMAWNSRSMRRAAVQGTADGGLLQSRRRTAARTTGCSVACSVSGGGSWKRMVYFFVAVCVFLFQKSCAQQTTLHRSRTLDLVWWTVQILRIWQTLSFNISGD